MLQKLYTDSQKTKLSYFNDEELFFKILLKKDRNYSVAVCLNDSPNNKLKIKTQFLTLVFLEKLMAPHLVKKFPHIYGTQTFVTVSQEPATGPYPQPY
jgi:hypothetical protein